MAYAMEFTGEITRTDGDTEDVYVSGGQSRVIKELMGKILTMSDGDSITISRTK